MEADEVALAKAAHEAAWAAFVKARTREERRVAEASLLRAAERLRRARRK